MSTPGHLAMFDLSGKTALVEEFSRRARQPRADHVHASNSHVDPGIAVGGLFPIDDGCDPARLPKGVSGPIVDVYQARRNLAQQGADDLF